MKLKAYDGTTTTGTRPPKKYDKNGKSWYFRFGDDNKISDEYSLSMT